MGAGPDSAPAALLGGTGTSLATARQPRLWRGVLPGHLRLSCITGFSLFLQESSEGPQELLSSLQIAAAGDAAHPAPGHTTVLAHSFMSGVGQAYGTIQHSKHYTLLGSQKCKFTQLEVKQPCGGQIREPRLVL